MLGPSSRQLLDKHSANNGETLSEKVSQLATSFQEKAGYPKGNPVGSREASRLSQRCREIVIGTILGDGCLERNGRHVRLRIDHSDRQRALVDWKFREFSELRPLQPRFIQRFEPRTGRTQANYRFATRTSPMLDEYFELFYGQGPKRMPGEMPEL